MQRTGRFLTTLALAFPLLAASLAIAAPPRPMPQTEPVAAGEHGLLTIESGTGRVLSLAEPAANVFVADPKVAEVRPASATSLFVFGISAGHTTVAAMDNAGRVLMQYNITVQPSGFGAREAQAAIARLVPGSQVQVQAQARGLLLTGSVVNPEDAAQAVAIAKAYAGENPNVENALAIQAPIQVTLNVRIANMSRSVVRNLGINWGALGNVGRIGAISPALTLSGATSGPLPALVCPTCAGVGFNGVIDALARDDLAHILAEPNLTVMSGQAASFQVGGEFPIPVGQQNGQISIAFKSFGVMLSFVPTVLRDGRINVHVKPEVSALDPSNGIQLGAGNSTFRVPALKVRRAETTVELGSGQSFAIAGLLQQTTQDNGQGLPGLGDVPVLGALFHDNQFKRTEDELVIVVTPYVVRPVSDSASLHLPTDGYRPPGDIERLLLMRQVADSKTPVPIRIPGDAGFVVQ
jgi:pilus assembly protein CpaC